MKKLFIAILLLLAVPVWAGPSIEYVTPDASETVAGNTERCTDAETVTGTKTDCAATAANITAKMAAPGAIGGTTPAAGTFTTLKGNFDEIVKASATNTLSAAEMKGQQINNYGQADDALVELAAAAEGLNFDVILGTTVAKYYRLDPAAGDLIILDGVAGTDGKYIGIASAVAGAAVTCRAIQTGAAAYDWACYTVSGAWVAE